MRILICLVLVVILLSACGEKVTPQQEPRYAIEKLKAAYDKHRAAFGSTRGYTVAEASIDADLDEGILERWKLSAVGDPPKAFVAVSTSEHPSGHGKRVVYDVAKKEFEGWMVKDDD